MCTNFSLNHVHSGQQPEAAVRYTQALAPSLRSAAPLVGGYGRATRSHTCSGVTLQCSSCTLDTWHSVIYSG